MTSLFNTDNFMFPLSTLRKSKICCNSLRNLFTLERIIVNCEIRLPFVISASSIKQVIIVKGVNKSCDIFVK